MMSVKHRRRIALFLFSFSLLFSLPVSSVSAVLTDESMVTLDISPKTVHVGDIITLEIFIKHKPGFSLYLPDSIDLSPFEIISTKVLDLKEKGGEFSKALFEVAVYNVGIFSIPNINLLLRSGDERIEISTPQRKLEVLSTLKLYGNSLIDISPPVDIRQSYLKYLILVWALSFLLIVSAVVHFRKKRKEKKAVVVIPKKKEDPNKVALELLTRIFSSRYITRLSDKELCENAAFTVKYFIKEKFGFGSMEMTSREVMEYLNSLGIEEDYLKLMYKFLNICDLVKFANKPLHRDDLDSDVEKIKRSAVTLIQSV